VASAALVTWRTTRRARLDALAAARPAAPAHVDRALVLALAAEFQGFTRELHDQAVAAVATALCPTPELHAVVTNALIHQRALDRGNARPTALTSDFRRLALKVWPALTAADPRAHDWRVTLVAVNDARNAIAHADPAGLARLGHLAPSRVDGWRNALDALATALDAVAGRHLAALLTVPEPW
jgi:hypothetical protein